MINTKVAELKRKNHDLRQLVIRLATIILRNVIEQRELSGLRSGEISPHLLAAMTPVAITARLREVSMLCSELSRDCHDRESAQALEDISIELANEAENLEVLLRMPGTDE